MEKSCTGPAGQEERKAPEGPTKADVALNGRGQSGRPRKWLHSGGARLSREEQGCESSLGNDGDLACRASQNGGAERLLRRCVLLQERHELVLNILCAM